MSQSECHPRRAKCDSDMKQKRKEKSFVFEQKRNLENKKNDFCASLWKQLGLVIELSVG